LVLGIIRYAREDSDLWPLAPEAGAYAILRAGLFTPDDYPERRRPLMGDWQFTGDSSIIDPRGEVIAGPGRWRDDPDGPGRAGSSLGREGR
jgi:hypothetical protein